MDHLELSVTDALIGKVARPGTPRRWSDDDDGARQQLLGLDHDAETLAVLLVAGPLRKLEAVHVTA